MVHLPKQAFFIYCLLLALSSYAFVAFDVSARMVGLMLVLWCILCGYVLLWLMNRYARLQQMKCSPGYAGQESLSSQLIYSMHSRQTFDSGVRALKTFNAAYILQAALLASYLLWGAALSLIGHKPGQLIESERHISDFTDRFAGALTGMFAPDMHYIFMQGFLTTLPMLVLIAIAYWGARVLSVSSHIGRNLPWFALAVFLIGFMMSLPHLAWANIFWPDQAYMIGYGWGSADFYEALGFVSPHDMSGFSRRAVENGIGGMSIFLCVIFSILIFIVRNFFHISFPGVYTLIALGVFLVMALIDIFAVYRPEYMALYLSGFAVIGSLGVQKNLKMRKRHTLYH